MHRSVLLLLMLIITGLAACSPHGVIVLQREKPKPIMILRHYNGSDPGFRSPTVSLINSAEKLAALGSYDLSSQTVDFAKESLLLLALGEKPTTGYWAKITGIQRKGGYLYVQGLANRPLDDDATSPALTYPYDAVVVKKVYTRKVRSEIESIYGKPQPQTQVRMK